jgi:hypothetical protein
VPVTEVAGIKLRRDAMIARGYVKCPNVRPGLKQRKGYDNRDTRSWMIFFEEL